MRGLRSLFQELASQNRDKIGLYVSYSVNYIVWAGFGVLPGEGSSPITSLSHIDHIIDHQLESELNEKH